MKQMIADGVEFFFGWLPEWMQYAASTTIAILIVMNVGAVADLNLFGWQVEALPVTAVAIVSFVAGVLYSFIFYVMSYLERGRRERLSKKKQKLKEQETQLKNREQEAGELAEESRRKIENAQAAQDSDQAEQFKDKLEALADKFWRAERIGEMEGRLSELKVERDELAEEGEDKARQRVEAFVADQEKLLKLLRDLHKIVETDDDKRIEKLEKQVDQREESLLLRIEEFHLERHLIEASQEGEDVQELEAELQQVRKALSKLNRPSN